MDEITEDGTVLRALSVREAYAKGKADMGERVAKYMEMRADLIGGEGTTVTGRTIARIYREEAGNIRALPRTNPEES